MRLGSPRRLASPLATLMLLCAVFLSGAPARAQSGPGPHFGATVWPEEHRELRLTWSVNRFTEFAKDGSRYNEITETSGFNMYTLSFTDRFPYTADLPQSRFLTYSVYFGGGDTDDQPSRWLQNEFLHNLWGLDKVPVGDARSETDTMAGASLTYWMMPDEPWDTEATEPLVDRGVRPQMFLGLGFDTGSVYQETYFHGGVSLLFPRHRLKLSLMHRVGFPQEGDAFEEVADLNNLTQLSIAYAPTRVRSSSSIMTWLGNPEIGVAITHDSGLFVDDRDNPISTWFAAIRAEWPTGLQFEIWNDIVNGTDYGPTMGFLLGIDLGAMTRYLGR